MQQTQNLIYLREKKTKSSILLQRVSLRTTQILESLLILRLHYHSTVVPTPPVRFFKFHLTYQPTSFRASHRFASVPSGNSFGFFGFLRADYVLNSGSSLSVLFSSRYLFSSNNDFLFNLNANYEP